MKRLFLLAGFVFAAAACTAPTTNPPVVSNANQNANVAAAAPSMTEADAIAKEKAIWETIKNKDYDAFSNMLAAEQLEILPDGVSDKAKSIAGVKEFEPSELAFADWKYIPIDKDAFIVNYSVTMKGKYKGKEFPSETARASSAWVKRGDKWEAIYHQESPVAQMPPPPPPSKSTPATSPSPVASPAMATTTSDVEANEKMAWDALKRRDYETFGSFLDEAQIEVEPFGVYDRAGTLKGIQMFDASKAELSDFKTVKFDDDATLITYLVKIPGAKPAQERHTTIWVNRGGKWRALFHQGTPLRG